MKVECNKKRNFIKIKYFFRTIIVYKYYDKRIRNSLVHKHFKFKCPECGISYISYNTYLKTLEVIKMVKLDLLLCCLCYNKKIGKKEKHSGLSVIFDSESLELTGP